MYSSWFSVIISTRGCFLSLLPRIGTRRAAFPSSEDDDKICPAILSRSTAILGGFVGPGSLSAAAAGGHLQG